MAGRAFVLEINETLVRTGALSAARQAAHRGGGWGPVYAAIPRTTVPPRTHAFIAKLKERGTVAIVTGDPRSYAERLVKHHGLGVEVIVAYHDTETHKPDPAPILAAAAKLGVPATACVQLATESDAEAALNAGALPLAIEWDAGPPHPPGTFGSWPDVWRTIVRLPDTVSTALERPPAGDLGFDEAGLDATWLARWHGASNLALFKYLPAYRNAGVETAAVQFVLALKRGEPRALDLAVRSLSAAIAANAVYLRDVRRVRTVVPLPGHKAGHVTTGTVKALAERLAAEHAWLRVVPAITRADEVPKSAYAGPGQRPTAATHLGSFRWTGGPVPGDESVLLLDDVVTAGYTSQAARQLVITATECTSVLGLFVARTI